VAAARFNQHTLNDKRLDSTRLVLGVLGCAMSRPLLYFIFIFIFIYARVYMYITLYYSRCFRSESNALSRALFYFFIVQFHNATQRGKIIGKIIGTSLIGKSSFPSCLPRSYVSSSHFSFLGVEYIDAIDMYITNRYLEGTFNSCSKVSVPSTGQLALDLMCGEWGASRCTPSKWFYFMGDAENNIYVPFQITYRNTDGPVGPFVPLDPTITPCSKPLDVGITFA